MKNLTKAALTISFFTLLSRFFGFFRDIVFAKVLGVTLVSDAFFAAFRLPNTFRRIFAEGALSSVFIPIFAPEITNGDKRQALRFAGGVLLGLCFGLIIITILVEIYMYDIISFINPGFREISSKMNLTVEFARITFLFLIAISITAFLGSILNSVGYFWYFAVTPIIFNIVIIASALTLHNLFESIGLSLSYFLIISGILQMLLVYYGCRKYKVLPNIREPLFNHQTKLILKNFIPAFISNGILQINIFVDSIFASLTPLVTSYLYYTDRIGQLPISLIGYSLSTSMLPLLSTALKQNNMEELKKIYSYSIKLALLLSLPVTSVILFGAEDIVKFIYQISQFSSKDVSIVSNMLLIYAISIPFNIFMKLSMSCFFAFGDTKAPAKNSLLSLVLNIVLNILLFPFVKHYSVMISTCIASVISGILIYVRLINMTNIFLMTKEHFVYFAKTLVLSLLSGLIFYLISKITHNVNIVIVSAIASIIVYIVLALCCKMIDIRLFIKIYKEKKLST